MFTRLRTLFGTPEPAAPATPRTAVPAGQRIYAIGDVHGRADLLALMIDRIEADDAARGPAQTTMILLGDLVDRGADSAGVITLARDWGRRRTVRYLQGNHEEMFLGGFTDTGVLRHFLRHGGRETLLSYPITPDEYRVATLEELQELMAERVPQNDLAFMTAMESMIRIGDYVFVHAGIRTGIALEDQSVADLRWIRGEFIDDPTPRDFAVVHGHTITGEPQVLPTRIGIDTGAFASGQLTAIGLEATDRWLVTVQGEPREAPAEYN
jgi:serine/threonine protein phosphatase 1